MDIQPEIISAATEYAATVRDFTEYEQDYKHYLDEEQLPERYKPAISAADLFKRPPIPVKSYVPGIVYAGSLNLIGGEPKAGKTTLVLYVVNAIASGKNFLGAETRQTNCLYVTEQNEISFRQEGESIIGFSTNPNIFILLPEHCPAGSWESRIQFWGERLDATKSGVLVIDTFGSFASLPPGGENDAACIADRLMALKQLYKSRSSLGIVLVHHIRKPSVDPRFPPKEFADLRDSRGSTAIIGGIDHAVMVTKATGYERIRNLHTEGRFLPENKFSICLTENGYVESNQFQRFNR